MPILPLPSFADSSFDHIISLGGACETAYNLRRHFGFATSYPFDWWISSTAGVAKLLRDGDVDALYRLEDLERPGHGGSVRNTRYDIHLHHEFPRDWKTPGQPVREDWATRIDEPRQRSAYLIERLFGLATTAKTLLFVRRFGPQDRPEAVAALLDALEARFPHSRIGVVAVDQGARLPAIREVMHRISVPRPPGVGWRGDASAWDAALGGLGIRLTPGLHRSVTPRDLDAQIAAKQLTDSKGEIALDVQ